MSLMILRRVPLFLLIAFSSSTASATKCLKATTLDELKRDFPIVVRGKVIHREQISKKDSSFELKIRVVRLIKGDLSETEIRGVEFEDGRGLSRPYLVGKEYTFPINKKEQDGAFEVVVPSRGCPILPDK